jgi:hypothetical protein
MHIEIPQEHHTSNRLPAWIALWVLLAILGQSVLPTLAYLRSDVAPSLWNEICGVYGPRQATADPSDTPKDKAPAHHADCPLCLHMFSDIILAGPNASAAFHLLFLTEFGIIADPQQFISRLSLVAEARGPPNLN